MEIFKPLNNLFNLYKPDNEIMGICITKEKLHKYLPDIPKKRLYEWKSKQKYVLQSEIDMMRENFWNTEKDGSPDIWNILFLAYNTFNDTEKLSFHQEAGLMSFTICKTEDCFKINHNGCIYKVPFEIYIDPPLESIQNLKLTVRLSNGRDLKFENLKDTIKVNQLIKQISKMSENKLKMMLFMGNVLNPEQTLRFYDIKDEDTVQAIIIT